jgi:hypothetical protein
VTGLGHRAEESHQTITTTYRARGAVVGALGGCLLIAAAVVVPIVFAVEGKSVLFFSVVGSLDILLALVGSWLGMSWTSVKVSDQGLTIVRPLFRGETYPWNRIDRVDVLPQSSWFSQTEQPGPSVAALLLKSGCMVKLRGLRSPWRAEPDRALVFSINEVIESHGNQKDAFSS